MIWGRFERDVYGWTGAGRFEEENLEEDLEKDLKVKVEIEDNSL